MTASVLLVDDDPALLRALPDALRLRMPDIHITTTRSAVEALQRAAEEDYDAIVTDIKMPGMDGLELLQELRRVRPATPTLLITGHGEHDLAVRALRGGAYDFIQKPIDRDYIVASLRRAIESRRQTKTIDEQQRALARDARVLNRMSEGVIVVAASGLVELWNQAAAFVTGIPASEAVGQPIKRVLPGWTEISSVVEIADGRTRGLSPPRIVPVEGAAEELWLSVSAARFDEAVIYTFRDTDVERALDELKTDFLATVSHELRTPLAAIYGAAATLTAREDLGEGLRRQLLTLVLEEATRLRRLVEDLLTASALDRNRVSVAAESVDPIVLVQGVVDAVRLASPSEPRIELVLPDDAPALMSDPDKLRQVLVNLVENALKYTPEGSGVTVGVQVRETGIRFFVRDRGAGIPPDQQRRIFDKFYRADPEQHRGVGGSGLGLYISRELVRRMGGRITVVSEANQGTTFSVDLPVGLATSAPPELAVRA